MAFTAQFDNVDLSALDIAANFCINKLMVQEVIQVDPSQLNCSYSFNGLRLLGQFLQINMRQLDNRKNITQYYLNADCSQLLWMLLKDVLERSRINVLIITTHQH